MSFKEFIVEDSTLMLFGELGYPSLRDGRFALYERRKFCLSAGSAVRDGFCAAFAQALHARRWLC